MLRVVDVRDERVDLRVGELSACEPRHEVGPDAERLGDLPVGRLVQRRHVRTGHVAALGGDLVASGAVVEKEPLPLGHVSAARSRRRHLRPVAE